MASRAIVQVFTGFSILLLLGLTDGFYVSYEEEVDYRKGDSISLVANKLTSPTALSSIDYQHLAVCNEPTDAVDNNGSSWKQAVTALHGDAFRKSTIMDVTVGQDSYCVPLCAVEMDDAASAYQDAIRKDFHYNFWIDGIPAGYRHEDDSMIASRYWGGIPVGTVGGDNNEDNNSRYAGTTPDDVFIHNHFNIEIFYKKRGADDAYNILRILITPYSFQQNTSIPSCTTGSTSHTSYGMLLNVPLQPATGNVRFSYDVRWKEVEGSYKQRWNIYLSMDGTVPVYIEFLGFFLGAFIFASLLGSLYTWVMRDLSYKPVVDQGDVSEEQAAEIQMWPLSTRVFFPPYNGSIMLCVACGTGAQLLLSGLVFVLLFRCGIISQAQGANLLTPGAIVYAVCSPVGGYVTARLYAIFHGEWKVALAAALATAIVYPLVGIFVLFLVYDVFPDDTSPKYNVMSSIGPLVLVWILLMWPLTVGGGYFGHKHGAIQNFPVSTGSSGYHDLNLQDNQRRREEEVTHGKFSTFARKYRIPIVLLTGGLLPVLSCFVSYSYGVAGPVFLGYYSVRSFMIASFVLFILVSGAVALLMYYRQIRVHNYRWWWTSFASGGSAGIYIFVLSMSWLIFKSESHISGGTLALYTFWFAYVSFGVGLMTGFAGLAACVCFNKALYTYITRRH